LTLSELELRGWSANPQTAGSCPSQTDQYSDGRAPIAQLVELRTFNPQVLGSSPSGGTGLVFLLRLMLEIAVSGENEVQFRVVPDHRRPTAKRVNHLATCGQGSQCRENRSPVGALQPEVLQQLLGAGSRLLADLLASFVDPLAPWSFFRLESVRVILTEVNPRLLQLLRLLALVGRD
jgi:hypothetical protein